MPLVGEKDRLRGGAAVYASEATMGHMCVRCNVRGRGATGGERAGAHDRLNVSGLLLTVALKSPTVAARVPMVMAATCWEWEEGGELLLSVYLQILMI